MISKRQRPNIAALKRAFERLGQVYTLPDLIDALAHVLQGEGLDREALLLQLASFSYSIALGDLDSESAYSQILGQLASNLHQEHLLHCQEGELDPDSSQTPMRWAEWYVHMAREAIVNPSSEHIPAEPELAKWRASNV